MPILQPNHEYLRFLNPFDSMFWVHFEMIEPEDPVLEEEEEKPEFTMDDFLKTFNHEFLYLIEEGKTLNPLYNVFKQIATELVSFRAVGKSENTWKLLVSLYIAHHLQMALGRMKNQADEISLTPEKSKDKKIKFELGSTNPSSVEHFWNTNYGVAFWTTYYPYIRRRFWGIYTSRGLRK